MIHAKTLSLQDLLKLTPFPVERVDDDVSVVLEQITCFKDLFSS